MMEAFAVILKEKSGVVEIVEEITELLMMLMSQVDLKSGEEKLAYQIDEVKQGLEVILSSS